MHRPGSSPVLQGQLESVDLDRMGREAGEKPQGLRVMEASKAEGLRQRTPNSGLQTLRTQVQRKPAGSYRVVCSSQPLNSGGH